MRARLLLFVCLGIPVLAHAASPQAVWEELHSVKPHADGWETSGADPFVVTTLSNPIPADAHVAILELRLSQPVPLEIFWSDATAPWSQERSISKFAHVANEYTHLVVNLNQSGAFHGARRLRVDVGHEPGVTFDIRQIEFLKPVDVPALFLAELAEFRCYTSKLHYQPNERIGFRATLRVDCYPDRYAAKVLELDVHDATGRSIATQTLQYGIRPDSRFKEVQGVLKLDAPLAPGRYTLHARSRDLRSEMVLEWQHIFCVQGPDDPFVYETPFKFVKDFSIIHGPDDRWHIFSITGDLFENHDWVPDGQERTFSHASSADLRHWTIHPPILSISNALHPDGHEYYKNRNIWAPHVIEHNNTYWMFYTSVNTHVSQSISLATSKDLFHWTDYEHNPVFTPEDVDWADWARNRWGDCRDACVLKDGDRFYLYATVAAKQPGARGAIVVAESTDLIHWTNASIAVRRGVVSESPQVWKSGDIYCMTASALGAATYVSTDPMTGWELSDFPRPDIPAVEKYVPASTVCAEEVARLPDGSCLIAGFTWRHWGNSIYIFKINTRDGLPVSYESPFQLGAESR